jgi:hypothetical protein
LSELCSKNADSWSKSTLPSKRDSFRASAIFSGLVTAKLYPVSEHRDCRRSQCKSVDSSDRGLCPLFHIPLQSVLFLCPGSIPGATRFSE